ncbi:MAG: hypothetical protein M0Q91_16095 [Methanoregula sp.]|jgi:hypothetical protein|nr:hypothetical protein [Methanoregula sp.]
MNADRSPCPYPELVALADHLFEECEDDVSCLTSKMDLLDSEIRNELLISDILNSYQAFYYYFRAHPEELVRERLELEPASSLIKGVKIDEIELLALIFIIKNHEPLIIVSDGENALITFKGKTAYAEGLKYIENPPY